MGCRSSQGWQRKHWKTLRQYYSGSPYFEQFADVFAHVYVDTRWETLSELNHFLIGSICRDFLGIQTTFDDSRRFNLGGEKQERLVGLLARVGCTHYLSGPAGRNYLDKRRFDSAGIELEYKAYDGYPEYSQKYPPFDHHVSIVDLLFNVGHNAPDFIWNCRRANPKSRKSLSSQTP